VSSFAWNGKTYPSLSRIAFAITGTPWEWTSAAGFAASGEAGLQPVAYRHQFIDLGDDAVLLGEGWERDWISSHHRHVQRDRRGHGRIAERSA